MPASNEKLIDSIDETDPSKCEFWVVGRLRDDGSEDMWPESDWKPLGIVFPKHQHFLSRRSRRKTHN